MGSGVSRVAVGSVMGSGANIDVRTLDFKPSSVIVLNVTGLATLRWQETMADAAGLKMADSGAGATDIAFITSLGITPLSNGFRIGADTDVNVDAQVIHWEAHE